MAVTKVTMYKTSKGEVHKTKGGAELAEKLDIMDSKLIKFIDDNMYNGIDKDDVISTIFENRVELLEILS